MTIAWVVANFVALTAVVCFPLGVWLGRLYERETARRHRNMVRTLQRDRRRIREKMNVAS